MSDAVDHPPHYTAHPSGVECIDVAEHMNFNRGNALKYLWRAWPERRRSGGFAQGGTSTARSAEAARAPQAEVADGGGHA